MFQARYIIGMSFMIPAYQMKHMLRVPLLVTQGYPIERNLTTLCPSWRRELRLWSPCGLLWPTVKGAHQYPEKIIIILLYIRVFSAKTFSQCSPVESIMKSTWHIVDFSSHWFTLADLIHDLRTDFIHDLKINFSEKT